MPPRSSTVSETRRTILAITVLIVAGIVLFYTTDLRRLSSPHEILDLFRSFSQTWWAPLLYVVLYVVFCLLLVPPVALSIAAPLIWGWFVGGLIEWVAATLAAIPPFLLARRLDDLWLEKRIRGGTRDVVERIRADGPFILLLVRLVPVVPFMLLNYVAGLVRMSLARYVLITAIGVVPSIFIFTWFVDSIASGLLSMREAALRVFASGLLLALLVVAGRLVQRRIRRSDVSE